MKKVLLSVFVVFTFIIYTIYQRFSPKSETITVPANSNPEISTKSISQKGNMYQDGAYDGETVDALYGSVKIRAVIKNGKLSEVKFLKYPNERRNSVEINQMAIPILIEEAIKAQNSQVDVVTGATQTSEAFVKSLQSALNQARG